MTVATADGLVVVRVFADEAGRFGNPLGVVVDGCWYDDVEAQALAASSGFSETDFIDDRDAGRLRIYVPRARVPFAGHPLVGAAWFLHRSGAQLTHLLTDAGSVEMSADGEGASIRTKAGRGVPWRTEQLASPSAVDAADASGAERHDYVWAWLDEQAGSIRARAFASVSGTREDEATGSAAVQLASQLGRSIRIHQGQGSQIDVRSDADEFILSGRVVRDA